MTRAPLVVSKSASPFGGDAQIYDSTFGWRFINPKMKEMWGVDGMGNGTTGNGTTGNGTTGNGTTGNGTTGNGTGANMGTGAGTGSTGPNSR